MEPFFRFTLPLAAAAALAACASAPAGPSAVATLSPTAGNTAAGSVRFVQSGAKVRVSGRVCDRSSFGSTTPAPADVPEVSADIVAAVGVAHGSLPARGGSIATACSVPPW